MDDKRLLPLGDIFIFTGEDLRRNRDGGLSWGQRRKLSLQFIGVVLSALPLVALPILAAWGLSAWQSPPTNPQAFLNANGTQYGYLFGGTLGLLYFLSNVRLFLLGLDLLRGRVVPLRGLAQTWGKYLFIGRRSFVVEEAVLKNVQTGLNYRVFTLPLSGLLLSIEFAE